MAAAACLLLAACTGEPAPDQQETGPPHGGTLRVAIPVLPNGFEPLAGPDALDPQAAYFAEPWALFRCCLLRTLMSYNGRPTDEGGSELRPDLASGPPEVSQDGLTWTFKIREELMYGPPLEDVEITTRDIVRALERTAVLGAPGVGYSFHYTGIEGFNQFAAGEADSISGLQTPDDHTIVIQLTEPQGDLGNRFSLAATAPIPPSPSDPDAPLGVAEGHDQTYGQFLVSSGPYMIEGSSQTDPSAPPDQQTPVSGFEPGKTLTLVRNPSWIASTDPLRPAYADRIELAVGGSSDEAHDALDAGEIDLVFGGGPAPQVPPDRLDSYQAGPGQVVIEPRDQMFFISLNVAQPPMDDVHVRRAVNLVIDKAEIVRLQGGAVNGRVATHATPDSLTGGDLASYDPYSSPDHGGSVADAQVEMAMSRYDSDGDGACDAAVCEHVTALEWTGPRPPIGKTVRENLASIGLMVDTDAIDPESYFTMLPDPATKAAMGLVTAWAKDFPNASGWTPPLFGSNSLEATNYSFVGATNQQLKEWGYATADVPNVDSRIDQCLALVGTSQTQCWTALDQFLMEEVVPIVPYMVENFVQVVPDRVVSYSYDQFTTLPALDRIALAA